MQSWGPSSRPVSLARVTEFRDHSWSVVPDGTRPDRFDTRSAFLLGSVSAGDSVLDLGCGDGAFSIGLRDAGAQVVGVEVSEEAARRARARGVDVRVVVPGEPLPFEDASFDMVWAGEVVTHVADLAPLLSEVRRVVRPEGRVLVTVPDHSPVRLLALALSPRRFAARFDPRSQHIRFFNRRSLRELLEDLGFADVDVRAREATLLVTAVRPALGRSR